MFLLFAEQPGQTGKKSADKLVERQARPNSISATKKQLPEE